MLLLPFFPLSVVVVIALGRDMLRRVRHIRVRVRDSCEIADPWFDSKIVEYTVIAFALLDLYNCAVRVVQIAKHDGLGWTNLLTGDLESVRWNFDI